MATVCALQLALISVWLASKGIVEVVAELVLEPLCAEVVHGVSNPPKRLPAQYLPLQPLPSGVRMGSEVGEPGVLRLFACVAGQERGTERGGGESL